MHYKVNNRTKSASPVTTKSGQWYGFVHKKN